ncbi:MAG: Ca2+-binding EF-hand superfamily protein [Paracoccaceae bacterium]|jgi:Ca2+-binding EF-hand superfamily protein
MKKTTLVGIIAAITISAIGLTAISPAMARGDHGGPRGPRINFEEVDVNNDGLITPEEMVEHRAARFVSNDTNGDGFLSSEELVAAVIKQATKSSEKRAERLLEHRDTDGDGQLSMAELTPDEDRTAKFLERIDADGDGAVSKEEMEAMKKRFGDRKHKKTDSE